MRQPKYTVTCKICNTVFHPLPKAVERGNGKCCSSRCAGLAKRQPLADRFWPFVNKDTESGCWLWGGTKFTRGYGRISISGTSKSIGAHRASWQLHFGEIPQGMLICHKCDTPECVNPAHLFLGTNNDNMQDKVRKNRQARGLRVFAPMPGEANGSAILTENQVEDIRERYARNETIASIARYWTMSESQIRRIVRRESWKHI